MAGAIPVHLLGTSPLSDEIQTYLRQLAASSSTPIPEPEVKAFPDAVYLNYFSLGLSLLYIPINGYKPLSNSNISALDTQRLVLDGIDVYNTPLEKQKKSSAQQSFSSFPVTPLTIMLNPNAKDKDGRPINRATLSLEIGRTLTGSDFVRSLGEPLRKGGGAGPSSGSIHIWCEWTTDGIMVEFGGDDARGPQAWERGKDAVWRVLSVFRPKKE